MSSANVTLQVALDSCDAIMLRVTPIKMSGNLMFSMGSMLQTRRPQSLLISISNKGQCVQELLIHCLRTDKKMGFARPLRNVNWFAKLLIPFFQHITPIVVNETSVMQFSRCFIAP